MKKKTNYLAKAIMMSLALGVSASMVLPKSAWADDEYNYMGNGGDASITYSPLNLLNVQSAYEKGYTGAGVTVGMNDDGLDARHQDFSSKSNTHLGVPVDWTGGADAWFDNDNHHGTHVAGIIAASKNGLGMHGVAYDANVNAIVVQDEEGESSFLDTEDRAKLVETYWSSDDIKSINCSWGADVDIVADVSSNEDGARVTDQYWTKYAQEWTDSKGNTHDGKLFFFASGNDGTFGPSTDSFAYLYDKTARNNIISVGSLSKYAVRDSEGKITVSCGEDDIGTNKADLLVDFSCLALGNEEKFVLGTGDTIYSVSAGTTNQYEEMSGTSMATPSVVGVAALVQQAFPYLTGKQIGDVILSTANKNVEFKDGIQVSVKDSDSVYAVNIYVVGKASTLDKDAITEAVESVLPEEPEEEYIVRVFSNVNVESLIGQGVADAGKAVNGLATLNARRLTNDDFSDKYTINGVQTNQAIYTVNTGNYNSTWSNDISEVRVGKLATDSSQDDLKQRATYYTTGSYDSYTYTVDDDEDDDALSEATKHKLIETDGEYNDYLTNLMQYYNEDLPESLIDLHVGLKKTGTGTLTLSGNNTYLGATIVDQGTLNIEGTIAGDAYAEDVGTLNLKQGNTGYAYANDKGIINITGNNSGYLFIQELAHASVSGSNTGYLLGSGTVDGNLNNIGTIGALTPTTKDTVLTIKGDLTLADNSTIQVTGNQNLTGIVNVQGNVDENANIKLTLDSNAGFLPGNSYPVLRHNDTNVVLSKVDTNVGTQGLLKATYNTSTSKVDFVLNSNNSILNQEQNKAVAAIENVRVNDSAKFAGLSASEQAKYTNFLNTSDTALQRKVAGELTSNASAQSAQAVQRNNVVGRMVGARVASVNNAKVTVPVQVTPKSLTTNKDAEKQTVTTNITVPVQPEHSFWAKADRDWGNAGDMDSRNTNITFGYDKAYSDHSRAGVLFSFSTGSTTGAQKNDQMQDYRLGLYHNFHNGADDTTVYLDYGMQRHDTKRYIYLRDNPLQNDYNSKVLELGAEYKHDLHANDGKTFHVAPYVNTLVSRYWQDGYNEGPLGQDNESFSNTYFNTGVGVEFSRFFRLGSYSARIGYKHVWTGASTTMNYNLGGMGFEASSELDKNFLTASYSCTAKLNNHGWSLEGETHLEKGAHDKNYGISATLKWEW